MSVEYDFKEAVEILEAFNRVGISYQIGEDGMTFYSDNDRERAKKVIEELKKKG